MKRGKELCSDFKQGSEQHLTEKSGGAFMTKNATHGADTHFTENIKPERLHNSLFRTTRLSARFEPIKPHPMPETAEIMKGGNNQ